MARRTLRLTMLAASANLDLSMTKMSHLPDELKTLGAAIRYLREKRGLTLRALATAVKISAPFLSDIEHNRRSTDKLPAFAKVLDVDLEELRRFDGRLTSDMRDWIAANPAMVALLKDIRASGRKPEELRGSLLRPQRR
jgi:transcriptional regulator with XRE-family HTH domain